jgi:hypothetical protein
MRSEDEVWDAFQNAGEHGDGISDETPLDWNGDNFKYGFFAGRLAALSWVLGDKNSIEINCNLDFEDFLRELQS